MQTGRKAFDPVAERVIEKNLIDDEGESMPRADFPEPLPFRPGCRVAGGVIRMNQYDGAGPGADSPLKLCEVDPPAEVLENGVRLQRDVIEIGEKIKERVARLGHEDFVTGVAQ